MGAYFKTAGELAESGKQHIPGEFKSKEHLIYSSPATLSFNSPGAQGFGVKRAGLAVPGSVMLLVAPGCCGRNTAISAVPGQYRDRFFFLLQDETDIVTGRHLPRIKKAVKEVVDFLEVKPSVVMICITCVDALLGTDMERVCEEAAVYAGVPVLPCYMYALTREGRMPPMTAVRKTVYALLEPAKKDPRAVNLLGEFAPFSDDSELYEILNNIGITTVREISRCRDFDEYKRMAEANFNIVLNPECRPAADEFNKRLNIPSIELTRLYQIDKIARQYELFGSAVGAKIDVSRYQEGAQAAVDHFTDKYQGLKVAVGEWLNADAFELSLALLRVGIEVTDIFGTITEENFVYIRRIAEIHPETRIYSNLSPTMLHYACHEDHLDLTIGRDAGYYHPDCPNIPWNSENKPFGFAGVTELFRRMGAAMETEKGRRA
ncbi:MAG: oxidoreductase [Lachnospiraceae bacterium]|nr:oxidoreductase [Lachnospiraceae bacterium]